MAIAGTMKREVWARYLDLFRLELTEKEIGWKTRYPLTWRLRREFLFYVVLPLAPFRQAVAESICGKTRHRWLTIPAPWLGEGEVRTECKRCLHRPA